MSQEHLRQVLGGTEWEQAALEMQAWQWEMKAQVAYYAETLTGRVVNNACSVHDLRKGVSWANALDAEATLLGFDIEAKDADGVEALARRLAHHAGRSALHTVRSSGRLESERTRRFLVANQ